MSVCECNTRPNADTHDGSGYEVPPSCSVCEEGRATCGGGLAEQW